MYAWIGLLRMGWAHGAMGGYSSLEPRVISSCASTLISPAGRAETTCIALPFGPQFVADIVNRTHVAEDQEQALLATELVLKAQKNARVLTFTA